MKALVLAGGTGSRLRPFSHSTPKQLVPVANKPVLFHGLEAIRAAGITDVGIIVNSASAAIRTAVGDGSALGVDVTYLPQDEPRGLAHCVMIARDYLGDDDFLMYLGDNVFADGITEPVAQFQAERPAAQLAVVKVADPSEYGVAELDPSGRVVALEEKPARPRSNYAVTGAYFFSPQIHEAVQGIRPSWRNELEITDALQWLVDQEQEVRAYVCTGYWKDTGNVTDLLDCNRALLEKTTSGVRGSVDPLSQIGASVVVEAGATVTASRIDGPAVIGSGTSIKNSYIGPYTAIGSGCRVENSAVEDSILLDRASIQGVRSINGSLIGRECDVSQARQELRVHRLIMGDDSHVEVPA
ncbi:glucose-1-phosphate thymidylyltransferase [Streptomyces armeniacus]|uniref:Glucose-1-phosphate thymidylyltransferase n=1 Tax=Streptomyces armeniacus TaxID=83291 RepID=A0A345XZ47_9ACTN|nr:glucose-1-phosphate thymidylyltransferase [Streptomyces armeniacus]AXK36913.1 glucose-1-phosphate thymidylyltransferase [Streptomyces armeniacus]